MIAGLVAALCHADTAALVTGEFRLPEQGGETAIINTLAPLGAMAAPLIIVAALASQLSAAVADMNGASGLVSSATRQHVPMAVGYVPTETDVS